MTHVLLTIVLTTLFASVKTAPSRPNGAQDLFPLSASDVTVVLKERFPQAHIAAVVRRTPGAKGMDVIAIKRSAASPELLAVALKTVAKSREQQGGTLARKATIIFPLGTKYPTLPSAERTRMNDAISRLLAAPPRAVPSVGNVPAISLDMTP